MTPFNSTFRNRGAGLARVSPRRARFEAELDVQRPELRWRSGGYCEVRLIGCSGRAQFPHHRKRRSQGGGNQLSNLLDSCFNCHTTLHADPSTSYDLGLLVRRENDPAKVPVLRGQEVWWPSDESKAPTP